MINENLGKLVQHARDKKPTDFKKILTSEIDSRIDAKVTEIKDGLAKSMFKENCEGHPDGEEHTHEDGTVHTHEGGDKEHTHEEVEEGTLPPALQKAIDAKKKKGGDDDEEDEDKDPVGEAFGDLLPGSNYDKKKDGRNAARKAKKDKKKKDEGTLPPALQKAIDAKKKNNSKSDDVDKTPEDDEDKKKDENLANFGNKKKIITKDDADGTEDGNDEPDVKDDKDGDHKPDKKAKKEDIRDAAKRILRGK
jgi:hypothetical protein